MKETKSKKNKVKRLVGIICLLLMFIIGEVHPTYVFAQVSESEIEIEETRETASKDNKEEKEVCFPNKLEAKEPPSDNQLGSQSDGINKGIPTAELYIFLGLLVMAVVGAGYYFKIYKKKQEESEDDEDYNELEDDYESEDNVEEPEEIQEETEQEEVDDMAIDAYGDEE